MSSKDENTSRGINFLGMLGILFIGLKLAGIINWPWWLVLLPLWWWIPVTGVIIIVVGAIYLILKAIK